MAANVVFDISRCRDVCGGHMFAHVLTSLYQSFSHFGQVASNIDKRAIGFDCVLLTS